MSSSVVKIYVKTYLLRVKKILKTASLLLLSLLLILFILMFALTGTDRGFHFLLNTVQDISSGRLQFSTLTGNLVDDFAVTDFQYHDPSVKLSIKQFHFDWKTSDLLSRKVTINNIQASGINVTLLAASKEEGNEQLSASEKPVQLPEIKLPIEVFLKQVQLTDINIVLAPGSIAEHIEKINLRADMINTRITLHEFFFSIPHHSIPDSTQSAIQAESQGSIQTNITGYAELTNNYPLTLQSTITLILPEQHFLLQSLRQSPLQSSRQEKLTIKGEISGDLSQLRIYQQTTGFLNASIKAQANHLLGEIDWHSEIQISRLPLELLMPESKQTLRGKVIAAQLTASGDLKQARTVIKAQLSETALLKTALPDSLSEDNTLQVNAVLSWHDAIKWQVTLQTNKLNPGIFQKEWPGALDIELHTTGQISGGQLSAEQYTATIQLDKLSGQLREKPVNGSGKFHLDNNNLSIEQLTLSSGDARLRVNGNLGNSGEKINLNWSLAIKRLSDLLPDAQGSINGQGNIDMTLNDRKVQQSIVNAQLKFDKIVYQNNSLNQADLNLSLNSNSTKQSNIDFNLQSLMIDSQEVKQLKLSLEGPLQKHQLKLSIQHEQANLTLGANGRFDIEQLSWAAQIKRMLIDGRQLGQWQQQTPAELLVSADKVSLSSLCLRDVSGKAQQKQNATLCTVLDWTLLNWTSKKGHARLNLNSLSFARIKPYFPEEITELTGELNIAADIDLGPQLLAHLKAEIKPGELIFQPLTQQPVKLTHQNGLITADYNSRQFEAQWHIEMGPHSINGAINASRKAIEKDPFTAPMTGNIKINIKDLNLLSILVPQITDASGHLLAQLKLGGMLGSPRVTGHADFTADYLSIRDAGIRIEDINITLQDKNNGQALALLGNLRSGSGQLELSGLISLNAEKGWPVTMTLKGDDFLIMNTPDVYAVISPDIQFRQEKGLMHFKGRIVVPEATISPSTIPEGSVSASPDVEVLGMEKETPANLDINITLALGTLEHTKGVTLDAFGLKTGIYGELTINQRPRQLMTAHGDLHLKDGTFRAYGQDLTIDNGSIFYAGGYIDNPGIKLTASRQVADTRVGIKVSGSAKKPNVNTFSDDNSLATKDIISMMLTGQKVDNLEEAKLYAGTEISDGLSVGVNAGMGDDGSEFITRYKLTDKIQLEGTSSATKSGGSLIYTFEVE